MAQLDFEQAMKRLEDIVAKLEQGDLTLKDSLKNFEEGIKLSRICNQQLEEAEKKIEILVKGEDGQKKPQPFSAGQQGLFGENGNV